MSNPSYSYLVATILADRVGILRDVTGALLKAGANLTDLRQNVIGGQFVLFAIADFEKPQQTEELAKLVRDALPEKGDALNVRVSQRPTHELPHDEQEDNRKNRYVAAVIGPDSPGRIYRIAEIFARHNVNVEDWRHDFSVPERTLTIGVVTIPPTCECARLRAELQECFREEGLAVSLLHENIFRATNEVGPIAQLLRSNIKNGVPRNA